MFFEYTIDKTMEKYKNGKDKWYIPYDYQVREEILLPCGSIRSEKLQES